MKILALFLCSFLLLLFFGTLPYVYLLWHQYWQRVHKLSQDQIVQGLPHNEPRASHLIRKQFRNISANTDEPIPGDKLMHHVMHYEKQIVSQLRNAVVETGKSFKLGEMKNAYHVTYNGSLSGKLQQQSDPEHLVCEANRKVLIETFLQGNTFFKAQQLDQYFPEKSLLQGKVFPSCGVVSSSGSLVKSQLGSLIDKNDFVIRFNNAPVKGYEKDVGKKTSLRIVNSQVVGKPHFKFLESKTHLYSHSPVLVCMGSFHIQCQFGEVEELHLLHPSSLWSIWNWLQSHQKYPLLPNPPSSGFLGLMVAVMHCNKVHVYEYVPSMRLTKRCHYYDEEENLGCTIGDWHPLAAEKLMALSMNSGNKTEVFSEGFITIKGVPQLNCQQSESL